MNEISGMRNLKLDSRNIIRFIICLKFLKSSLTPEFTLITMQFSHKLKLNEFYSQNCILRS